MKDYHLQERNERWYDKFHAELCEIAENDEICCNDRKSCIELEDYVEQIGLSRYQQCVFNDYIACLLSLSERHSELAYDLGKETMKEILLNSKSKPPVWEAFLMLLISPA